MKNLFTGSAISHTGVTEKQPFISGTGNSMLFRIPALITLQDGSILAAADARYTTSVDGGGLDTMISMSKDGGKTWNYSFPIYFGDSDGFASTDATTIIDPVLVQGSDGTIYLMADVNPTGYTTCEWAGFKFPLMGTGYVKIDEADRLVLTSNYNNTTKNPAECGTDVYEYYVGDLADGYAPVIKRTDNTETVYVVDQVYNLYEKKDGMLVPLSQKQVNTENLVQQNVFYKDSILHVYNTGYMWLATSRDAGTTWSHEILNPQIKKDNETGLLVTPGRGIETSDGTIVIPFYHFKKWTLRASFIYLKKGAKKWIRSAELDFTSSESEMIELSDGTLRMVYRSNVGRICYVDAVLKNGDYVWKEPVEMDIPVQSNCNVSAITYSKKTTDGNTVVLVACPETGDPQTCNRRDGRIYTFVVEEDQTMTLVDKYCINEGTFQYSCLTELTNGDIAILYENGEASIVYESMGIQEVAPSIVLY